MSIIKTENNAFRRQFYRHRRYKSVNKATQLLCCTCNYLVVLQVTGSTSVHFP